MLWFDTVKGFGFIQPESKDVNGGKDLFVHFHFIVQRGFKALRKGDTVEFCLGTNKQGAAAHEVKLLVAAPEETANV